MGGKLMWATRSAPQSFSACYVPAMCCCVMAFSIARMSVAEMTFSLAHVLNVAFVHCIRHINEIGRSRSRSCDVVYVRLCSLVEKCDTWFP